MQIESRTCQACLSNYAEMQLCLCKEEKTCHITNPSTLHHLSLYHLYIYRQLSEVVCISIYMRMDIVSTATHPFFSFHCILIFLFSSLILSSKPHICTSKQVKIVKSSLSVNPQITPNSLFYRINYK